MNVFLMEVMHFTEQSNNEFVAQLMYLFYLCFFIRLYPESHYCCLDLRRLDCYPVL